MPNKKTQNTYQIGLMAETLSSLALRLKGYKILARRYQTHYGEIDIVARRRDTLAIIEVKARATLHQGLESIAPRQRERIEKAAQDFIAQHPDCGGYYIRFDVILVTPWRVPRHIPNAWLAS